MGYIPYVTVVIKRKPCSSEKLAVTLGPSQAFERHTTIRQRFWISESSVYFKVLQLLVKKCYHWYFSNWQKPRTLWVARENILWIFFHFFRYLLSGIDLGQCNHDGRTPLHVAAAEGMRVHGSMLAFALLMQLDEILTTVSLYVYTCRTIQCCGFPGVKGWSVCQPTGPVRILTCLV